MKSGFSFSPAFFISVPPRPVAGLTGYVTNGGSNNILIFDKRTGEVAGVIATEGGPAGMALDQRGLKAYVALPSADAIEVVDVIAGEITDRIRLTMGDRPRELALTPDGKTLLSVNGGSNSVSFIDTASLAEQARVTVGNGPASVLIDPSGRRAYVFNNLSSTVSVIDIANRALVTTIGTDPGPLRGQFNSLGDTFYVIHEWSPYVSVIDRRETFRQEDERRHGPGVDKDRYEYGLVYMGRIRDRQVGVYDPNALVPVDYLDAAGGRRLHDHRRRHEQPAHGQSRDDERVVVANLISKKTLSVIDVGEAPYWVTVMGER